jgi:hypothetical protein
LSKRANIDYILRQVLAPRSEEEQLPLVIKLRRCGRKVTLKLGRELIRAPSVRSREVGAWLLAGDPKCNAKQARERSQCLRELLLHESSPRVIARIIRSLHTVGNNEVTIAGLRGHRSVIVRSAVAESLGTAGQRVVLKALGALARDADARVREWAMFSLGQQPLSKRVAAIRMLRPGLADGSGYVRAEAARGLVCHRAYWVINHLRNLQKIRRVRWESVVRLLKAFRIEFSQYELEDPILDALEELVMQFFETASVSGKSKLR